MPGQAEHLHHLHWPITGFRYRCGLTGQHRLRGGLGINGVGLAPPATASLVGLVDLEDLKARSQQISGQRCAVGAGALHPGSTQHPELGCPPEQLPVTAAVAGKLAVPSSTPSTLITAAT